MFGMDPVILDSDGLPLKGPSVSGALCLGTPWPGIARFLNLEKTTIFITITRTVHGDHQRFVDTYFSTYKGYYFTGDGALRDEEGFYQITGRMDDVINVTGHRLGTAEVEDALMEHPALAEAAVVGFPHEVKGEGVYAYVILKEGCEESMHGLTLEADLRLLVKSKISGFAVPDFIQITTGLPKTRSGKIMRRILRKVAAGDTGDLGDTSTLAEPAVVNLIVENHWKLAKK